MEGSQVIFWQFLDVSTIVLSSFHLFPISSQGLPVDSKKSGTAWRTTRPPCVPWRRHWSQPERRCEVQQFLVGFQPDRFAFRNHVQEVAPWSSAPATQTRHVGSKPRQSTGMVKSTTRYSWRHHFPSDCGYGYGTYQDEAFTPRTDSLSRWWLWHWPALLDSLTIACMVHSGW